MVASTCRIGGRGRRRPNGTVSKPLYLNQKCMPHLSGRYGTTCTGFRLAEIRSLFR